ncbi:MAG: hypothetical protein HZC40_13065 [Chloroflexi bacterium]|nr:hypothetical protein [Chloroflexota bacterium]
MGRIIGIILIVAGLAICGIVSLFLFVGASGGGPEGSALSNAGAILGVALFGVLPLLILGGVGVFLFIRGGQEEAEMVEIRKKERLLGMIQTQGKVALGSAALELKMTRDQLKNAIYELVNQGLFSGYADWGKGEFYSKDLAQMQTTKCPNCGGEREAVGKGLVKCQYCGVELFLPQS